MTDLDLVAERVLQHLHKGGAFGSFLTKIRLSNSPEWATIADTAADINMSKSVIGQWVKLGIVGDREKKNGRNRKEVDLVAARWFCSLGVWGRRKYIQKLKEGEKLR